MSQEKPLQMTDFDWIKESLDYRTEELQKLLDELKRRHETASTPEERYELSTLYLMVNHIETLALTQKGLHIMIEWSAKNFRNTIRQLKDDKDGVKLEIQEEYAERLDWLQEQMLMWKRGLENAKRMVT